MNRKNKLLLMFILCLYLFTGCSSIEFNIEDTIKPPENQDISIQGTWKIVKYIPIKKEPDLNNKVYYEGKKAIFDNELCALGKDVCINPEYKIINTTADTFIQNRYRINESILNLKNEDVNVITIITAKQSFYEMIVVNDSTAYVYIEKGFLELKKISGKVDDDFKKSSLSNVGMNRENGKFTEDPLLRSGVLIGIRSEDNTYRTIWIYSKNREIKTLSYGDQLLVPRAKGFWKVGAIKDGGSTQNIYAEPFLDNVSQKELPKLEKTNSITEKSNAKIVFVGNDYIGIEHNSRYNVLPIDKLGEGKGISLSDIIDDAYNALILCRDNNKAQDLVSKPDEENFTLSRRNGHWIMKSRWNYKEPQGDKLYEDFDLKLMVPQKLIYYDEMDIPWNEIKSKIPWITDAYMSPNKDIAILASKNSLQIYPVQNKGINNKQLLEIPLEKGDSIIMTEWSIGKYADIWSTFAGKSFNQYKEAR